MLLKIGSKGDLVLQLQRKLGINPDGDFGQGTEKSVMDWQRRNGLKSDGVVGDVTWNKLFAVVNTPVVNSPLNINKLKGIVPDSVISQLPGVINKFNINSSLRLAHFLSQCAHESGNFSVVFENLNYSESGLINIFKNDLDINKDRILSDLEKRKAKELQRNPQRIANFVYANQNGNGGESTGDGWKFRGRGYIQLTGRENYKRFTQFIGVDALNSPDIVANTFPLASAAFFFSSNSLWSICDKGSSDAVVLALTKRVNGGTNGYDMRLKEFKKFYNILK